MFLFIIFFLPIILFFFGILYMLSGKSDSPKSNSSRGNYYYYDDYDEPDYDPDYDYYNSSSVDSTRSEVSRNNISDDVWKPLPDYSDYDRADYDDSDYDEYGYYCPECDADLYDDDCEHRDDWI